MVLSKVATLIASLLLFFFLGSQTFAQSTVPPERQAISPISQVSTQRAGSTLQARALMEIDRRIAALENAAARVDATAGLSPESKTLLMAPIQAEIKNLTELKTQIETESDATALGALVASLVSSYRVYALFVPKIMIISSAEKLLSVADLLTSVQEKILETALASGQDVAEIETLLTDAEENITSGRESAESAIEAVSELDPAGYPGNRTALQSARADLVEAKTSLIAARESLGEALTAWQTLQSSGSAETSGQDTMTAPTSTGNISPTTLPANTSGNEAL